jgi:basic membrane protein A
MKRVVQLVIVLVLLTILATACGAKPEVASSEGPFKVAVVMPSAINDLAFSQSMYDTMLTVQKEMGGEANFQFVYSDNMFVVDDASAAIRDYASQGYNLIIAHGSQYGASLKEIAPDFPKTSFAWGTAGDTFDIPNIFAYEAFSQEGGYVNGVLAAALNKSGTIGVVGPIEVGDAKLYVDGFIAGAKAAKPDIQVNVNYIGSFSDVALASESAQTHVGAGADVLTGSAQMVVGAIGVAEEKGVLWFGTQSDQSSLAPSIVVASQVYDWTVVVDDMIALIKSGTLGGKAYAVSLENEGLLIKYNSAYNLPADVKALGDQAIEGIKAGTITIGVGGK